MLHFPPKAAIFLSEIFANKREVGALQAETRDILAGMQTFLSRFPHASNKKSGWGVKIRAEFGKDFNKIIFLGKY